MDQHSIECYNLTIFNRIGSTCSIRCLSVHVFTKISFDLYCIVFRNLFPAPPPNYTSHRTHLDLDFINLDFTKNYTYFFWKVLIFNFDEPLDKLCVGSLYMKNNRTSHMEHLLRISNIDLSRVSTFDSINQTIDLLVYFLIFIPDEKHIKKLNLNGAVV